MDTWRFIDTGEHTGEQNMRYDEMLAQSLVEGRGRSTVRIFRGKPWAISLGYNQDARDLDVERCSREGIDVVRRPTGGRAILHAEELTYSVVMFSGRKSVLQVYNDISRALVRGLAEFGVDARFQKSQPDFREEYRQTSSIPCFTSSARYEIEWRGRKLVGSAQRRFSDGARDVVLQHGSILCGSAHRRLADYLAVDNPRVVRHIRSELERKTVDLSELLGRPVDLDELGSAIRKGFALEWGVTFENASADLWPERALPA